jgi:hypothetical protein
MLAEDGTGDDRQKSLIPKGTQDQLKDCWFGDSTALFERTDWSSMAFTILLTLCVYLVTLAPEVTLGMSGILSTAAMYGGVAHNPGFPVWTLYAWLFTKVLPFSNIAWRVAVSSAVASSITCGMIALIVSRHGAAMLENLFHRGELDLNKKRLLRWFAGLVAGATYGFNGVSWNIAVTVDTRALGICLFSAVLCLLMRWSYTPAKRRFLYAAFLTFGLTIGANAMLLPAALALPFFVLFVERALARDLFFGATILGFILFGASGEDYFYFLGTQANSVQQIYFWISVLSFSICIGLIFKTRRLLTEWKLALGLGGLTALALLAHLYLPIASMMNPPSNWGYPRTVEGFYHVLSRGQYERFNTTCNLHFFLNQIGLYFIVTTKALGIPLLLFAVIPFLMLKKMRTRERGTMLGLVAFFLCTSFLITLILNPPPDAGTRGMFEQYLAPSFVVLSIWSGLGLILCGGLITQSATASFKKQCAAES